MSNDSAKSPARPGLSPLLLAIGAVAVYFLLISQWQATPEDLVEQAQDARSGAAQLELSRRLSAPGVDAGGAGAPAPNRSWMWPIAAFVPPLLIGMLWGSARVKGTDEALIFGRTHLRVPEPEDDAVAEPQHERPVPGDAQIDSVARSVQPDASEDDVPPAQIAPAASAAHDDANDAELSPDDEVAALRAALRARDEVIRTLEDIVRENRESWSEREGSAERLQQKIHALQAELDAANDVIELLQLSDAEGRSERDDTLRPQVLERS